MRALTVHSGLAHSVELEEVPPPLSEGDVVVDAHALGICGTDREIVSGAYGWAPPGEQRLIIGHESLGHVLVFGTVNANRRHYRAAADALAKADKDWLSGLITRRIPLARWRGALEVQPNDIKVVLEFN